MTIKELLEGKEINHVKFGKGVIQTVTDNNAVQVQFEDGVRQLTAQALANGKTISFMDPTVMDDLNALGDIAYKATRLENANTQPALNGYREISMEEDIRDDQRNRLLDRCFGPRKWPGQTSFWNIGHGYMIWLPCLSEYYKGEYHATDADKKWINYFEDGNKTIVMKSAIGEALEQDEKHEKTFVFMKEKGEYIYRGVFEKDLNDCNEEQTVYRLVEETTDTSPWWEDVRK